MRRLLILVAALALAVPLHAGALPAIAVDTDTRTAPVEDSSDIERFFTDEYGDPTASGTRPFFASGTDLAFDGDYVYAAEQAGSGDTAGGIHIYDVSDKDNPVKVGFVDCPGYQNDVAVVEPGIIALAYHSETGTTCADVHETKTTAGVRLFDVSDPTEPKALGVSSRLPGGTHTLTVHPSGDYIYASPGGILNGGGTQQILDISDREGPFKVHTFQPNQTGCHDFSFFTATDDRSMGVCVGLTESQIWDLTDPTAPEIASRIVNPLIDFHHTGVVSDDGRHLVIGDEAIVANDCVGGPKGAMFAYDISDPELPQPRGYFAIDRAHEDSPLNSVNPSGVSPSGMGRENWCTAHLFNFIPDTNIMVAVWYSGGVNVIDWGEDFLLPREVAHFRTDGSYTEGEVTNYWSGYWHDGRIYANDRVRGFDALRWTAYDEAFGNDQPSSEELTDFVGSLPSTDAAGWRNGRFFDTPTPAQAAWLAARPKPSLGQLSPFACRLSLL